jgi:CheY-like chemotaxis protein
MTASPPDAVLIVDDDEAGRYVKVRMLQPGGYRLVEAGDGASALRMVAAERPSLVVLDVKLPDMSGIDVCREIKKIDPRILVLHTSAEFTGGHDRVAGAVGGADGYLTEPLAPEELTTTVNALLRLSRAERELRRANEGLEERIQRRTRQIADINERLLAEIHERAKAEEVVRHTQKLDVLGQLTGGIAHDFNNLLMVVLGNLETLRRQLGRPSRDEERIDRAIENASRGARRAASLTQQLLAFARRQPLDPKPLSVSRLVSNMQEMLRRILGESVAVDVTLPDDLWVTHADRNQLENAVLNLAVNARDAMPDGGRLSIRTANVDLDAEAGAPLGIPAGQYVMLDVTDSGRGMTGDVIAHAFEPFFTTKDVGQGTGLGLSQVYGFVSQSGGAVGIDSELGRGTRVRIYLPRFFAGDAAAEAAPPPEHVPLAAGETVLVVEDDVDVRAHTTGILGELGYRVVEAGGGNAALAVLQNREDIALLFTDVGLPGGMNGVQLAEEVRRRRPHLPILFTTGYGLNSILADAGSVPPDKLLRKPFAYAALAAKLRESLSAKPERPHLRILLVEDDALVRMAMVDALEDLGFRVEEAATGGEAIAKALSGGDPVDAAIIDIGLPDRSGDGVAAELRRMSADLPIIVASGYSDARVCERFSGDRRISFLGKPYDVEQVSTMLRGFGIGA